MAAKKFSFRKPKDAGDPNKNCEALLAKHPEKLIASTDFEEVGPDDKNIHMLSPHGLKMLMQVFDEHITSCDGSCYGVVLNLKECLKDLDRLDAATWARKWAGALLRTVLSSREVILRAFANEANINLMRTQVGDITAARPDAEKLTLHLSGAGGRNHFSGATLHKLIAAINASETAGGSKQPNQEGF